jgi:hypothetical protein
MEGILAEQGHGRLGHHPREPAPVRPRRGMNQERVAEEHVPGAAGGQGGGTVGARLDGPPGRLGPLEPVVASGSQDGRDVEM